MVFNSPLFNCFNDYIQPNCKETAKLHLYTRVRYIQYLILYSMCVSISTSTYLTHHIMYKHHYYELLHFYVTITCIYYLTHTHMHMHSAVLSPTNSARTARSYRPIDSTCLTIIRSGSIKLLILLQYSLSIGGALQ